jgi:hypothetical protein
LGVSDVGTIIADFGVKAVAKGWTDEGGGLFSSPVDADGRWIDVLLTQVTDNQKLEWRVRDKDGVTLCTRRINMPSTNNWAVRIFVGAYHAIIDVDGCTTTYETLQAGILDLSPEDQDAHSHWAYGTGSRTTGNSLDANGGDSYLYMIDNVAAAVLERVGRFSGAHPSLNIGRWTLNGSRVYRPREVWNKPAGVANLRFAGRCYQQVLIASDVAPGAEIKIPVDTSLTATFKVLGLTPSSSYNWRVAVRIA